MYDLPTTVIVDEQCYSIRNKADYRVILDAVIACQDPELTDEERVISSIIIFYEDVNSVQDVFTVFQSPAKAFQSMMDFISLNNDNTGCKVNHKLIDWEQDEKIIVSAINNVARTEIRALPYLHWWTFIGYYMAVGESSLSTIVGIRSKIARGKKLEKYEQNFKRENPQYFSWKRDEKEAKMLFAQIWEE